MKNIILFLLVVPLLVSCAALATPAATLTVSLEPTAEISTEVVSSTAPIPMTMNPAMGNIEGKISWLTSNDSNEVPISRVNLELNGHSEPNPRYTAKTDDNGYFSFVNIEPMQYGIGVYFNLAVAERLCEAPVYQYSQDLGWLHYATALKGDIWYDILFSNEDVVIEPGETVVLDFRLNCP